ncbi:Rieske (2Fe-2S) protein [Actinosynnema sp. NPDC020468]|uniref:Rieske (2Fe-2S) protein n=1 Tax=Actinosynnema sp. NPDC020468 TaxID=3154488 RepID=UPI0033EAC0D7
MGEPPVALPPLVPPVHRGPRPGPLGGGRRQVGQDVRVDRRTLLCGALLLTTAACGTSSNTRKPGPGSAKPGDRLAAIADIPVGAGVLVDVATDGQLLLVRPTADVIKAFNPTCPHAGSVVNPPTKATPITCPTHHSEFDSTTGAVRSGPSPAPLKEVPITLTSQDIHLA